MSLHGVNVGGTEYHFDYEYLDNKPFSTGTVTIPANWLGDGPYHRGITIPGIGSDTKIDLMPDATTCSQLAADGTYALWVENDDGSLTVYAMGAAPTASLTVGYVATRM